MVTENDPGSVKKESRGIARPVLPTTDSAVREPMVARGRERPRLLQQTADKDAGAREQGIAADSALAGGEPPERRMLKGGSEGGQPHP